MNFVDIRLKSGLTQKEIEIALELKASTVSKWEQGKVKPRLEHLNKLSELLNCNLSELIKCFVKQKNKTKGGKNDGKQ